MGNRSQKDTEHLLSIPEANAAAPKVSEQDKGAYRLQPGLKSSLGYIYLDGSFPWGKSGLPLASQALSYWSARNFVWYPGIQDMLNSIN